MTAASDKSAAMDSGITVVKAAAAEAAHAATEATHAAMEATHAATMEAAHATAVETTATAVEAPPPPPWPPPKAIALVVIAVASMHGRRACEKLFPHLILLHDVVKPISANQQHDC